ncbi:MAG: L,D-transpeptidase [Pseudomonadota bacterium]
MLIEVHVPSQTLHLKNDSGRVLMETRISTGRKGVGEQNGSEQTPRGWHKIRAKIGVGQPENTVFVARRPTGELYAPEMRASYPNRDWILTRILWLSGLEPGRNRLGKVDTMRRFIYIHGCPDDDPMGAPGSRGCVKKRHRELIEMFDRVPGGTRVHIIAEDA